LGSAPHCQVIHIRASVVDDPFVRERKGACVVGPITGETESLASTGCGRHGAGRSSGRCREDALVIVAVGEAACWYPLALRRIVSIAFSAACAPLAAIGRARVTVTTLPITNSQALIRSWPKHLELHCRRQPRHADVSHRRRYRRRASRAAPPAHPGGGRRQARQRQQ